MSEVPTKTTSESEDLSDNLPDDANTVETSKTATSSSHHDSEYDTASDTPSSDEADDLNDDDFEDDDDEDDDDLEDEEGDGENDEEGSIVLDLERQRGDGEEQDPEKKKVDDDEDRSNPQYIPKRGVFYEHDDRTADEPEGDKKEPEEGSEEVKPDSNTTPTPKKPAKKSAAIDRWSHDRFNANEQAPKSRAELVNSYGYDIRNEDGPPRARRRRRYGRGPNKYTRKWEDESAYAKITQQQQAQRNPRPEDFPELGTKAIKRNNSFREEKENKNDENQQRFAANRSPVRRSQNENHDRFDRQTNERFEKNRGNNQQNERFDNRQQQSQPQQFSNNDRYERSQNNERYDRNNGGRLERSQNNDGGRQRNDRFDNSRSDRFEDNSRFDRQQQQNDRYDGNRSQNERSDSGRRSHKFEDNDRYDDKDRNWDRRNNRNSSGGNFRTGKTTLEFKNQNRNKSMEAPNTTLGAGNKNFNTSSASGFNNVRSPQYEYDDEPHIESISFTNTKLGSGNSVVSPSLIVGSGAPPPNDRYNTGNIDFEQHRGNKEIERLEQRPITGRQHQQSVPLRVQNTIAPIPSPQSLPNATQPQIGHQQQMLNQQSLQPQLAQQQLQLQASQQQQAMNEASRTTKRYSASRQRSAADAPQQPNPSLSMHEQQLMIQTLQDIQLQPNLAAPTNYIGQQIPLQLQSEYSPQISKPQVSQPPQQQSNQVILAAQQQQQPPQAAPQTAQYQGAYYSGPPPNEYGAQTVVAPTVQPLASQQAPANPQIISAQQYPPPQYTTQPSASYIQNAPPPAPYIQQQAPPATAPQQPPTANTQQQLMNYVPSLPTLPPTQPQFQAVPAFPTYPAVPAYNSAPSGITYYAPQTQMPPRPILAQQRRPTNAIPILAPPERAGSSSNPSKSSQRNRLNNTQYDEYTDEDSKNVINPSATNPPIGSPENIDHILDNMFVQRAPYQPPTSARKSNSPAPATEIKSVVSTSATPSAAASLTVNTSTVTAAVAVEAESTNQLGNSLIDNKSTNIIQPIIETTKPNPIDNVDIGVSKMSLNEGMQNIVDQQISAASTINEPYSVPVTASASDAGSVVVVASDNS